MKKIAIFALPIFMLAYSCGTTTSTAAVESLTDTVAVVSEPQKGGVADGLSGATNSSSPTMLNGTMIVPAENNVTITLPMGGTVASFTHLPGKYVQKGETIVVLENTEFIDLQQSYLESSAQCDFLESEYNRQRALSDEDATSHKRLQQSHADYLSMKSRKDASSARLKILGIAAETLASKGIAARLDVKAPQSGYVSEVMVNQGKYVAAGETICMIVNKNQILLNLIAYEKDLKNLKVGQKLEFRVNGLGNDMFLAVVSAIDQRVDPVNRSVKVYAKALSTHSDFRPGMYVLAQIKQ